MESGEELGRCCADGWSAWMGLSKRGFVYYEQNINFILRELSACTAKISVMLIKL